jgi:hypothetical protein
MDQENNKDNLNESKEKNELKETNKEDNEFMKITEIINIKHKGINENPENKIKENDKENENENENNIYKQENINLNLNTSINCNKDSNNTDIVKKSSNFQSILRHSITLFSKIYSIRIIYSLLMNLRSKEKRAKGLKILFESIFNLGNLTTSLSIGTLPLFYDILKRIIVKILRYFKKENNSDLIVFISGFISSYLSMCFGESSKLVNYIVLSITVRAIYSWLVVKFKDNNNYDGKFWSFIKFFFVANSMIITNLLNPSFEPITSHFDGYLKFVNINEKTQFENFRNMTRIV